MPDAIPGTGPEPPPLCTADDATFWPWISWPGLAAWPHREETVVVIPIAGMADWGLGHPLDAEETVAMAVLREASRRRPPDGRLLVLPPLRFAFGPDAGCAFGVDPPLAHALIAEVAGSVAASGFRRVLLLNASPWNEEICAAASRDLRLARDLRVYRIHLAALGLDFHPRRSPDRRRLQTLLTALTGREPEPPAAARESGAAPGPVAWSDESVLPLAGPAAPLSAAAAEGAAILETAAARLAGLIGEIARHQVP